MKRKILFTLMFAFMSTLVLTNCGNNNNNDDDDNDDNNTNLTGLAAAKKDYQDNYLGTTVHTIGWSGATTGCLSGDISSATRLKVVQRINYYRRLVGLPANITLNTAQNKSCQDAALYMLANNTLNHTPTSGSCLTADAYAASSTGNIAIGWGSPEATANHSINAVSGYIKDPGAGNEVVGHRAWLFCRKLSAVGTGSVYDPNHTYSGMTGGAANCIRWGDNLDASPTSGPEFVAYPPDNYIPSNLVFPRWHFAYPNASFTNATVVVKDASGTNYPCTIIARKPQQGSLDARVVWEPQGLNINTDMDFTVTVSNVSGAGSTSYSYVVKAFHVTDNAKSKGSKNLYL